MTNKLTSIDTVDALKIAVQCSQDMSDYYEKLMELVNNENALAILRGLAEKHDKHRTNLTKIYSKISGKKILYLNLGKKHKITSLRKCGSDPYEAIDTAKKNENIIKSFYLTVSRRIFEPKVRYIFRKLAVGIEQNIALLESSFSEPELHEEGLIANDEAILHEMAASNQNSIESWQ
jgi:rubrerythrin